MMIPKQQQNPLIDLEVFLSKRKQTLPDWMEQNNITSSEDLTHAALHGVIGEFKISEKMLSQMVALVSVQQNPAPLVETEETDKPAPRAGSRKKAPTLT